MRYLLFALVYVVGMALILAAGLFPVVAMAGHSGTLSGGAAELVWVFYGLAVLIGPWPVVRWLSGRCAVPRKTDA